MLSFFWAFLFSFRGGTNRNAASAREPWPSRRSEKDHPSSGAMSCPREKDRPYDLRCQPGTDMREAVARVDGGPGPESQRRSIGARQRLGERA